MASILTERDWAIRAELYRHFVDHAALPDSRTLAGRFDMSTALLREALQRLHAGHALFLDPSTGGVRMLNPFSAVSTPYVVEIGQLSYFANCAWDMLGIPGMLGTDALIRSRLEVVDRTIEIPVRDGVPQPDRDYIVNFSIPFRNWYADLIHT